MQAGIYVRVSTEEQTRHGFSLGDQRKACRERAFSLGASDVREYADEGISGGILDRPGLAKLRDAARKKEIDMVVVRDPDRFSRKLAHQLLLTEELEKYGVKLEFIDFNWQDTPEGRLFYSIRGAISEFEREKIRDRMVRGKIQKARQGGIPMGFYAYGYVHDTEAGRIKLKNSEAEVVKHIYVLFVTGNMGINGIAKHLNEKAVPTKKGKPAWHRQVVRQILQNPVYKGEWQYKDLIIPVPPVVSRETWDRAQDKLGKSRRLWAGKSLHSYLLSGIITCADCGNTMTGYTFTRRRQETRRYTCRKNYQGAKNRGCFPPKSVPASPVENMVWQKVCSWIQDPGAVVESALAVSPGPGERDGELEQVEKQLQEVEKNCENIIDALSSGLFQLNDKVKNKLGELKKRRDRLEQQKGEILNSSYDRAGEHTRAEYLYELAREILNCPDQMEFKEKKALTRALVEQVTVSEVRGSSNDFMVTVYAHLQ